MTRTVSREDWTAERTALLEREKAHIRAGDALAKARRALPRVRVDADYRFGTARGQETLGDLFKGHAQLAVYHFMFGADWPAGCPSCSFWADVMNGTDRHLAARDTSLVLVSSAPYPALAAYRERMGWSLDWVSSEGSEFNRDFGATFSPEELAAGPVTYNYREIDTSSTELPGFSAFVMEDGAIYHSYSTFARGLETFNGAYGMLDLTAKGRHEGGLSFTQAWVRRRDEY